ncbi:hypothetical protein ASPVEDRAFT_870387 [Aspergillus versicolor CBS 583.65]|uniref:Uncharacterized protein n=1 Tax=Aspergillus versicolor CBS 583.65 TaxID=1036611 RepID=A0A1L9PWC1_ASPVE|nr:uncharacterized protein ASPVEDRAFT_870387 [Aspergillus versicolor CBS 583.65]OJJ05839.1 hypothetical protein ASPVEDRAFT_870387 [Aspergillus versicolor CBS 583.65]
MSQNNLSTLAKEAAKLVKLSSLQNGLPGSMRAIPVGAIVAGCVIARVAGTSNILEKRMIGADEMIALDKPKGNENTGQGQVRQDGAGKKE